MRKQTKKIFALILLLVMVIGTVPINVLAESVGVKIRGSISINVVTTIIADIERDLSNLTTTPTYVEIENQTRAPIEITITDIETESVGAPGTFVEKNSKTWSNLSQQDTETYIAFTVNGGGQGGNLEKNILPDTNLSLGTIFGDDGGDILGPEYYYANDFRSRIYELNAYMGNNWSAGDKEFTYQITMVASLAEEYVGPENLYTYPNGVYSASINAIFDATNEFSWGYNAAYQNGGIFILNLYIIKEIFNQEGNDYLNFNDITRELNPSISIGSVYEKNGETSSYSNIYMGQFSPDDSNMYWEYEDWEFPDLDIQVMGLGIYLPVVDVTPGSTYYYKVVFNLYNGETYDSYTSFVKLFKRSE